MAREPVAELWWATDPTPPQTGAAAITGYAILSIVTGAGVALYTRKKAA